MQRREMFYKCVGCENYFYKRTKNMGNYKIGNDDNEKETTNFVLTALMRISNPKKK